MALTLSLDSFEGAKDASRLAELSAVKWQPNCSHLLGYKFGQRKLGSPCSRYRFLGMEIFELPSSSIDRITVGSMGLCSLSLGVNHSSMDAPAALLSKRERFDLPVDFASIGSAVSFAFLLSARVLLVGRKFR